MYYIFKAKINLKKESEITDDFKLFMDLPNIVLETAQNIEDDKIKSTKDTIEHLLKTKFKMNNIDLELINIIE